MSGAQQGVRLVRDPKRLMLVDPVLLTVVDHTLLMRADQRWTLQSYLPLGTPDSMSHGRYCGPVVTADGAF
jgi:hypothetical protein